MKKRLTFSFFLLSFALFAQKTKQDQTQLHVIKNLYKRLEHIDVNTKEQMIWRYKYNDSSLKVLQNFSKIVVKENVIIDEIVRSNTDTSKYTISVSELKKYTPEELLDRLNYINDVAKYSRIKNHYAIIEGSNVKDKFEIQKYKPIGKKQKAIKED
jgi:hypothetical protein